MLDPALIRREPDAVKAAIERKGDHANLDEWLTLDGRRRTLLQEVEELKSMRNRASEEIGLMRRDKKNADKPIAEMKEVSRKIATLDAELRAVEEQIYEISIRIPNVPDESVPVGDESANRTEHEWGTPAELPFEAKSHWELGESLGILDFTRSSKLSGSGFSLYWRDGAALQRALIRFMIDLHTKEHGYEEVYTPFLVSRESMFGTGQLPKMEEDMYRCRDDELFLIPTAEVPITNAHADEIFAEAELPRRYVGYTPCFRREAGSAGKETRGLNRMHQFDKVELVRFERTEDSYRALDELLGHAEEVLKRLELPYRVLTLATGDLSFAAAKTFDIEVWAPGQKRWLEVSSCSNFLDFQARRARIRYRVADRKENRYVHTLNGSGLALPRLFIALLETFQQADGSVAIPAALQPYFDGRQALTGGSS